MAYTRPGKLHRVVQPPEHLVTVDLGDGDVFTDDQIRSLVIRRGSSTTVAGLQPYTLEVELSGLVGRRLSGRTVTVTLAPAAAVQLALRLGGHIHSSLLVNRFRGRVGTFQYNDSARPSDRSTTIMAGAWIAQESNSGKRINLWRGQNILAALDAILSRKTKHYGFVGRGSWDQVATPQADASFDDVWGKYAGDIGIATPILRNGNVAAVTLPQLRSEALARVKTTPHLLRSQVLAPSQWEQPNESNATEYGFRVTSQSGDEIVVELAFEWPGTLAADHDYTEVDWSHLWDQGHADRQFTRAAQAHILRESSGAWFLTGVKVDLLALMRSSNPYDHRVAAFLLSLETTESVNIAGDWPFDVRGIYFASEISETITGHSWEMSISLRPFPWVVGESSPPVPALVWDSHVIAWDQHPSTWDQPQGVSP